MPADGLTKADYKASLYLREVMKHAWFSWVLDEASAERKAEIKEQRKAARKENSAKKIKELRTEEASWSSAVARYATLRSYVVEVSEEAS